MTVESYDPNLADINLGLTPLLREMLDTGEMVEYDTLWKANQVNNSNHSDSVMHLARISNMARVYLDYTRFAISPDNPWRLTADEKTDFEAFRSAWYTILGPMNNGDGDVASVTTSDYYEGSSTANKDVTSRDWLHPPALPEGWIVTTRMTGMNLQPVLCRKSILDMHDPSWDTGVAGHSVWDKFSL